MPSRSFVNGSCLRLNERVKNDLKGCIVIQLLRLLGGEIQLAQSVITNNRLPRGGLVMPNPLNKPMNELTKSLPTD